MVQRCGIVLVTLCSVNRYFNLSGLVFTRIVTETHQVRVRVQIRVWGLELEVKVKVRCQYVSWYVSECHGMSW